MTRAGIAWVALIAIWSPLACGRLKGGDVDAGGGVDAGDDTASDAPGDVGPPSIINHPNPIISRQKMVVPAAAAAVNNGTYHDGGWSTRVTSLPASAAINIGAGPTRVLVQWDDGGTYDYEDAPGTVVYGLPKFREQKAVYAKR